MDQQPPKLNIDLKNTEKVETPDGNYVVAEGIILRKASRTASEILRIILVQQF